MVRDSITWKILLDIVVLACSAIPLLILSLWAEPYHRGYHPEDHSLSLPYKPSTVPVVWLAIVGFAFNIVTILVTELIRGKQGQNAGDKFLCGTLLPGWVWESYTAIGIFGFGAAMQQTFVNLGKYVVGRLRPHFFDVCRPLPDQSSVVTEYIQNYTCSANTDNPALLKDMRLSFPSAHSSFAMYCAVFFIFYVQEKGKWRGSKLLRHGIQYAVLMSAWWIGLSRIVDNMHHWSDVAAGFLIGATFAVLVFIFILKPKKYGLPVSWQENIQPNILPRAVLAQ